MQWIILISALLLWFQNISLLWNSRKLVPDDGLQWKIEMKINRLIILKLLHLQPGTGHRIRKAEFIQFEANASGIGYIMFSDFSHVFSSLLIQKEVSFQKMFNLLCDLAVKQVIVNHNSTFLVHQ